MAWEVVSGAERCAVGSDTRGREVWFWAWEVPSEAGVTFAGGVFTCYSLAVLGVACRIVHLSVFCACKCIHILCGCGLLVGRYICN